MEMSADVASTVPDDVDAMQAQTDDEAAVSESERAQVKKIVATIKADCRHHEKAFKNMRRDMFVAKHGYVQGEYGPENYKACITGRHVKQKTAALYAKNPKVVARRRETLDFAVWDESPQSLQLAMQTIQTAQMLMAQTPPDSVDPVTGAPVAPVPPPAMQQAFEQAMAVMADYQQGLARRKEIARIGKTLEVLFTQAMREQKPVDFKTGIKQMVRRACTTGVGYVELGFQRETGPRPGLTEELADVRTRLDHLRRLSEEVADGEIQPDDPEMFELEQSLAALEAEPEIILREGLIFDFPASTRVIPDRLCTKLVGFIGARHVTVEYLFTTQEVTEMFGVDLGEKFAGYSAGDNSSQEAKEATRVLDDDEEKTKPVESGGIVKVWKHFDKPSGLVYYVVEGYDKFLRAPAAPDVFVEDFWPVYALTFNDVEDETDLFPPSDVTLMLDMQREYNRSRQGLREHRRAARPRFAYARGALSDEDIESLKSVKPFEAIGISLPPGTNLADVLQQIQVPGVDNNLYGTEPIFTDVQLVVGSSEAQFGGVAQATATESAIAAGASAASDSSSVDDLDAFLTVVARASGQILMREMSPELVMQIVGPGALWPQMTLADIASELFLEVEAGSTGKPNQAVEVRNWKEMLPFLIQMPGIDPVWLAKETVRRLDDKLDVTEAISAGLPSIVMQNRMSQPGTGDAQNDPTAQGAEGGDKAPKPTEESAGSGPAFGSNQV